MGLRAWRFLVSVQVAAAGKVSAAATAAGVVTSRDPQSNCPKHSKTVFCSIHAVARRLTSCWNSSFVSTLLLPGSPSFLHKWTTMDLLKNQWIHYSWLRHCWQDVLCAEWNWTRSRIRQCLLQSAQCVRGWGGRQRCIYRLDWCCDCSQKFSDEKWKRVAHEWH